MSNGYVSGTQARKDNAKLVDLLLQIHSYASAPLPWYVRLFTPRTVLKRLQNIARATNPHPAAEANAP